MPTGIGSGIAGEVFTDEIGSGSRGGSTICPTRYSVNLNGLSQIGQETGTLLDLGTNNFSYSFWFKTSETSVQGIFSTDFNNTGVGLDIFLSASGILTATFDSVTFPTTASLNDGEWYHAVLSVDRSGDWKWYIDGINTNTLANPVGTAIFVGNYLWGNSFSTSFFNGNLTELSIWGTALSLSEVLTIYNNMFGSQTCLTDLTFGSGNLIQNGSFNEIGPQLIDNPTFNAPTSPNLVDNPNFTDTGTEEIVDGGFPNGSTAWNLGNGGTIVDNEMQLDCGGTTDAYTYQSKATAYTSGKSYKLTVKIVSNTTGTDLILYAGGFSPNTVNISIGTTPNTYSIYFVADYTSGSGNTIVLRAFSSTGIVVIDDVSVKELGADWTVTNADATHYVEFIETGARFVLASTSPLVELKQTTFQLLANKSYKLTVDMTRVSGSVKVDTSGVSELFDATTSGTNNTRYITPTGNIYLSFYRQSTPTDITFHSVSVQEVDWAFEGGWSLGSNKALATAAAGGDTLYQAGVFTLDKSYKTTFLSTLDSGNCFAEFGSDGFIGRLPSGTASNLFYYQTNEVGDSARIAFEVQSLMTGSISNVLTYQMDPNGYWNIPTANSTQLVLNPMFTNTGPEEVTNGDFSQTALGTDLVTDGDFPLPNANWVAQGGAEITTDGARINNTVTGVNAYIAQLLLGTLSGKSFVLTYDVITTNGETLAIEQATSIPLDTSTTGTNRKLYFTWNRVNNNLVIKRLTSGTDVTIDNVSVKEVLQLVTNGDFTDTGAEEVTYPNFTNSDLSQWIDNGGKASFSWDAAEFMRLDFNETNGNAMYAAFGHTLNASYKVTMRVRGTKADGTTAQGSAFSSIGNFNELGQVVSNPTLTSAWQDYEFYVVPTNVNFRFYLASVAIGDLVDFDSISVKELGTGWSVQEPAGQSVDFNGTQVHIDYDASATQGSTGINQSPLVASTSYKIILDIATLTGDSGDKLRVQAGGVVTDFSDAGVKTFYITTINSSPLYIVRASNGTSFETYINSISVQELGQDWTVGTGWSFGDDIASCDGTASSSLYQNVLGVESKTYKITGTVSNYTSGTLQVGGSSNALEVSGDGAFIHYRVWTSDPNLYLKSKPGDGFNGSITNISVKETGLDWISPDAGVVNTFSATGLTMTSVNGTGDNTIQQVGVTADDQAYKVDYNIVGSSLAAGNYLQFYNGATYVNMKTSVGNHILHFTRSGSDDSVFLKLASNDGSLTDTVDIGSITIVEVQGWTLEDGKLVGDLPDLAKSATQDIGAIAGNSYKATMDVALAEEELITNGSFRQVGTNVVDCGDFSCAVPTDYWAFGTGWSVGDSEANCDGSTGNLIQSISGSTNKSFKLVFTISNFVSGSVIPTFVGITGTAYNANGTYTEYIQSGSDVRFVFYSTLFNGSITNVSVQEVGQDWTLGTGWSIGEDKATFENSSGAGNISQYNVLEATKSYKLTFDTLEATGNFAYSFGGSYIFITNISANTTHTVYGVSTGTTLNLRGTSNFAGSITNISVEEVGELKVDIGGAPVQSITTSGTHSLTFTAVDSDPFRIYGSTFTGSVTNIFVTQVAGGTLERWWRVNGNIDTLTNPAPNVASNGISNDLNWSNNPPVQPDTP